MRTILKTIALLAVIMFSGCAKDLISNELQPVEGEKTTVVVGLMETKTYLGDLVDGVRKVYWSEDDQIAINGVTSSSITLDENKTSAQFAFDNPDLELPYSVLYPAEMYKDAQTITLPALQGSATGSFADDASPMAAYQTNDGTVKLHHLTGVVRLLVTLPADSNHGHHSLNKIEFRGKAGEQVSGDFAIDYHSCTLTSLSTAEADQVVTTKASKALVAGETDDVFIVVPAQEYTEGFTVRLIDDAGHYMDIASKAMTIAKGEIKAMPVVEFAPTGTLVGVEIASAEDLIAFANAYNAGNYADVEPLNVKLTQDIVFDDETNAAWEAIGVAAADGAAEDNYFNGCFDGQGFSIKNWVASRPLFGYTSADGVIENLTIDASCVLTPNFAGEIGTFGGFVGYHRGLLLNCHNNAGITATGEWTKEPHIGGLVGRVVVGTVENCTVAGDVTFSSTLVSKGAGNHYYGGAVGRISNADGVVKNVKVLGNVTHRAGADYIKSGSSNNNDANLYFGGVVGHAAGTVENCHLYNETIGAIKFFYGNFDYWDTSVELVNNNYRNQCVGGVVGCISESGIVNNCTNRAVINASQFNGYDANGNSGDVSRYLNLGGIVGETNGTVKNCTSYATIINRSSCLQQNIAGIVAQANATAAISNCVNEGEYIQNSTASMGYNGARNARYAGIIGYNKTLNLSNLTNKATIQASRPNTNNSSIVRIGGIIGECVVDGTIDGNNTIINEGQLESLHGYAISYTTVGGIAAESTTKFTNVINRGTVLHSGNCGSKVYLGGVVGYAKADVAKVTNEGAVYDTCAENLLCSNIYIGGVVGYATNGITISYATNKGGVKFDTAKSEKLHYNVCVGGILGSNNDSDAIAVTNSTNRGYVVSVGTSTNANRSMSIGGIVGGLTNGGSSISSCANYNFVGSNIGNNQISVQPLRTENGGLYIGGIAGYVEGSEGNLMSVTDCVYENTTNTGSTSGSGVNAGSAIQGSRGLVSSLVAVAKYADIKNCSSKTTMYLTNTTIIGGLVTVLENSNLEGCVLEDSKVETKTGSGSGGLIAKVTASTVKNNTIKNTLIKTTGGTTNHGILAGISDDASTFTDNKVSGTFQGNAITLDLAMIGSGNPTVTGTLLYTE